MMNDVLKTIVERRAVRKYKDQTVSKELIEQVLETGKMAPSALGKEPLEILHRYFKTRP